MSQQPAPPPPPPAPYPAPPPAPYGYPPPAAYPAPLAPRTSHFHDGEVITDFATVGTLAAIDLAIRADIQNGNAVSLLILGGLAGGGGVGYLLTQKFDIDAGAAHATTLGMMLGIANGALLIEPGGYHDAAPVMGLLTLGSVAGTAAGFIYGQNANLTNGQALFVGNVMMLGSATALLTAITGDRDGNYGAFENTTLLIGLDGGAVAGALIAPHLDWSPRRAKYVFASTFVGALVGSLLSGAIANPHNTDDTNSEIVAGAMTAGLWGGFGLGILLTHDDTPDLRYQKPATNYAPMIGPQGQLGMLVGGTF